MNTFIAAFAAYRGQNCDSDYHAMNCAANTAVVCVCVCMCMHGWGRCKCSLFIFIYTHKR